MGFAPLDGERLVYDAFRKGDAETVARLAGDPEVARYTARIPSPYGVASARAWIVATEHELAAGSAFVFALRRRGDQALIGAAGVQPSDGGAEVGYWIGRDHWGRGYATEAARRMIRFAFRTLGVERVGARIHVDNFASMRVVEKAGLVFRGHDEMLFPARGEVAPVAVYAVSASDWRDAGDAAVPVVLVAAAALLDDRDRVLLAERPAGRSMAGTWEFPGGKVGPGESVSAALVRELGEELGLLVTLDALEPLATASHRYESFHLLMPLLVCRRWGGVPEGREGQRIGWIPVDRLDPAAMPPADAPLVDALRAALSSRSPHP